MRSLKVLGALFTLLTLIFVHSVFSQQDQPSFSSQRAELSRLIDGVAERDALPRHISGVVTEYAWLPAGAAPSPAVVVGNPGLLGGRGPTPDEAMDQWLPQGSTTSFWTRNSDAYADTTDFGAPPACRTRRTVQALTGDWYVHVSYDTSTASVQPSTKARPEAVIGAAPSRVLSVVGPTQVDVWREWLEIAEEKFRPRILGAETIDGVPCEIMCYENKQARMRFWVASSRGFCIMRSDRVAWEGRGCTYMLEQRADVKALGSGIFAPQYYEQRKYCGKLDGQPGWQWTGTKTIRLRDVSLDVAARRLPDLDTIVPSTFALFDTRCQPFRSRESLLTEFRDHPPAQPDHEATMPHPELLRDTR